MNLRLDHLSFLAHMCQTDLQQFVVCRIRVRPCGTPPIMVGEVFATLALQKHTFRLISVPGLAPPSSLASWRLGWSWPLVRRGFALELAAARVCREAGARVAIISCSGSSGQSPARGGSTPHSPVGRDGLPRPRCGRMEQPYHRQTKIGENISRAEWSIWPGEGRGPRLQSGREVVHVVLAAVRVQQRKSVLAVSVGSEMRLNSPSP